jgi:hypothetical protein
MIHILREETQFSMENTEKVLPLEDCGCSAFNLTSLTLILISITSIGIAYTTRANAFNTEETLKQKAIKVQELETDITARMKKIEDSERRARFIEMDLNLREQEVMGKIEISHLAMLDLTDQVQVTLITLNCSYIQSEKRFRDRQIGISSRSIKDI